MGRRKRGNPQLAKVRNRDTSAANAARTTAADDYAEKMFSAFSTIFILMKRLVGGSDSFRAVSSSAFP